MTILRKAYPVEVRATEGQKGQVEAIVSVFGNVDLGGDRVVKGAFAKSIERWKSSGFPVPVIFSHDWGDLWSHIGVVDSMEETDQGLKTTYTLDVDDNPAAAQVYRLMKRGTLKEHSFGYQVVQEKTARDGANELLELEIIEVGPTLKGMNPDTEVLAVKSALEQTTAMHEKSEQTPEPPDDKPEPTEQGPVAVPDEAEVEVKTIPTPAEVFGSKAGRTLSKANETKLRNAMDAIAQVLSSLGDEPEKAIEAETERPAEVEPVGKASDLELLSLQARIMELKG